MTDPANIHSVTVVVVSYNTRDKLRQCLQRLSDVDQVIVIDNASTDGSAEMVASQFPDVTLVANDENVGFGPANNQGLALAAHEHVLYLNSDAYALPGAIEALSRALTQPGVVAVGPKLLNPDGSLQDSTANELTLWAVFCEQCYLEKLFPNSRVFSPYWTTRRLVRAGGVQPTPQVMGAALMCRANLEAFDDRYFLYCEDTDLCLRLARHGKILYVPDAQVEHDLGSSSSLTRWRSVARYNRGKELYFQIHHGDTAMAICWLLNRSGALLRLLAWTVYGTATLFTKAKPRSQMALFARVFLAPPSGPTRS